MSKKAVHHRTKAPIRGRRSRSEAGFSLIETMIAMVVMGIGLLAVGQMIPLALVGVSQAGVRTNAVQSAQQRLDEIRSNGFDQLDAGTFSEVQGNYTLDWTITDDDPVQGSKRIVITAAWETIHGTRSTTLRTLITRGN